MSTRLLCLGILSIGLVCLTSCSSGGKSAAELQQENAVMVEMLSESEEKVAQLEAALNSLTGGEGSFTAITDIEDGSGQTFTSIGGKILFPTNLEYTNSKQAPNNASLSLSDRITIVPSNNWVIQMNGTTTKFYHQNGITGEIKVSALDYTIKNAELYESSMKPFIDSIPYTNLTEGKIYLEQTERGLCADLNILNNSKPAVLTCGMMGYIDTAMVYTFYYEGDYDATKDELVRGLLKTIKFGEQQLRIE